MRVGLLWSSINRDMETNRAAPRATRALVRRPAGCWRHWRSRPMRMPSSSATALFSEKVQPSTYASSLLSSGGRLEPGAELTNVPNLHDLCQGAVAQQGCQKPGKIARREGYQSDALPQGSKGKEDADGHDGNR